MAGLFVAGVSLPHPAAAQTAPMKFGMDVGAITPMKNAGVPVDYATMWVGVWTLKSGWGGIDGQLDSMYASGTTPVIHFYYWGNDISKNCLENGCWSSVHNSWKSKSGWQQLAQGLTDHLQAHMKGRAVVIVIETEFNKNDVSTYEALDYYLAQKAKFFEAEYPAGRPTLGFGNWGASNWGVFDRAAAASTYVGTQAMRGSTRDSVTSYTGVVSSLLSSVKTLKAQFGKPVFITDIALSSHSEPTWLKYQASTMKSFMDRRAEFKAAGAVAMVYRGFYDAPNANLNEYYGEGERHFGLAWSANKTWKPAMKSWVAGIKAERGTTSTTSASSSTFSATFTPAAVGNDNWVEVKITATHTVAKAYAKINGGPWYLLTKQSSGNWARALSAPDGATVQFRAFDAAGQYRTSSVYTWSNAFSASFTPSAVGNDWWVETKVTSSSSISKVEVNINNGGYKLLERTDWGTWAKSYNAPNGAKVVFRATNTAGATATSSVYTW